MAQYRRKNPIEIRYPFEHLLSKLGGGKWESRILIEIAFYRKLRYSELKTHLEPISDTILTNTLKKLLEDQFVTKSFVEQRNSLKVYYSLTERSRELIPILQAMCRWHAKFGSDLSPQTQMECRNCPIRLGESPVSVNGCEREQQIRQHWPIYPSADLIPHS